MTVRLLVDAELVISAWLRASESLADLAAEAGVDEVRVVTEWGRNQAWPACRITRIGGSIIGDHAYAAERVLMQFDVAGGPRRQANRIAEALRAVLVAEFNGELEAADTLFVAHQVTPGGIRPGRDPKRPGQDSSVTDGSSPASKPLVSFDATFVLKPSRQTSGS